jgi:hypothetical protein
MDTFAASLLMSVDRFSNRIGPVNALINAVLAKIAPLKLVNACHTGIVCFTWCEWTDFCCGDCLGFNRQLFYSIALPGHEDCSESAICDGPCTGSCGACNGCR